MKSVVGKEIKADLFIDNTTTLKQIKDGVMKRTEHLEIEYYYIHEKYSEGYLFNIVLLKNK